MSLNVFLSVVNSTIHIKKMSYIYPSFNHQKILISINKLSMKQKITPFIAVLFTLVLFINSAKAQTVSGTVKDFKTNETLFGATVVVILNL